MELIAPCKKYYSSYIEAIKEFSEHEVDTYQFLDASKYDIFEKIQNFKTGKNLPLNYVKATYLWLVEDDEFIGEVSIRHELTDSLLCFGGNIGYGIRYSKWNKGYGTIMLSLALKYAKEVIGLEKVLITCNDNNLGSARVIEKNFGVLQDKIINVIDGVERITRRYWIEIK
ncbi:GNAT family N-acetyltransferase [Hathewaya massiliensis]|uniref:GNAT family N-acetyltransferase n=1 Tax=Hathewaya massiliensis TaxID=1964382 RepID=UPI00115945F9|nr:GNAT family N-acetyltransferase [Hathewaya massiliensis]